MTPIKRFNLPTSPFLGMVLSTIATFSTISSTYAAIALDRTRAVFTENDKSISLTISNENTQLPYLAQGWVENEKGEQITDPFIVLPPMQRLEPGTKSQIKIQGLPTLKNLPQDRESVFYFSLREIPPKSDKPNSLQLALQTRIKLFYRPKQIIPTKMQIDNPWQEQLTLQRQGNQVIVENPTPFNITIIDATASKAGKSITDFDPIMVPPKGSLALVGNVSELGNAPVLTYINDHGGRPKLQFECQANSCSVVKEN